jgi:hypothetical protein
VLKNCEPAALELATSRFAAGTQRFCLAPGNILRVASRFVKDPEFDRVIAGGLFDCLSDQALVSLLRTV